MATAEREKDPAAVTAELVRLLYEAVEAAANVYFKPAEGTYSTQQSTNPVNAKEVYMEVWRKTDGESKLEEAMATMAFEFAAKSTSAQRIPTGHEMFLELRRFTTTTEVALKQDGARIKCLISMLNNTLIKHLEVGGTTHREGRERILQSYTRCQKSTGSNVWTMPEAAQAAADVRTAQFRLIGEMVLDHGTYLQGVEAAWVDLNEKPDEDKPTTAATVPAPMELNEKTADDQPDNCSASNDHNDTTGGAKPVKLPTATPTLKTAVPRDVVAKESEHPLLTPLFAILSELEDVTLTKKLQDIQVDESWNMTVKQLLGDAEGLRRAPMHGIKKVLAATTDGALDRIDTAESRQRMKSGAKGVLGVTSVIKDSTLDPELQCVVFCGADTIVTAEPVLAADGQRLTRAERSSKLLAIPSKAKLTAAGFKSGWLVKQAQQGGLFRAVVTDKGAEVLAPTSAADKVAETFKAVADRLGYRRASAGMTEQQHDIETWVLSRTADAAANSVDESTEEAEPDGEGMDMEAPDGARGSKLKAKTAPDDRRSVAKRRIFEADPNEKKSRTKDVASTPSPRSKVAKACEGSTATDVNSEWNDLHGTVLNAAAELLKVDLTAIMYDRGEFFETTPTEHPTVAAMTDFIDNAPAEVIGSLTTFRMRQMDFQQQIKDDRAAGRDPTDVTVRKSRQLEAMLDKLVKHKFDWDDLLADTPDVVNMRGTPTLRTKMAARTIGALTARQGLGSAGFGATATEQAIKDLIESELTAAVASMIEAGENGLASMRRRAETIVMAAASGNFLVDRAAINLLRPILTDGDTASPHLAIAISKKATTTWEDWTAKVLAHMPALLGSKEVAEKGAQLAKLEAQMDTAEGGDQDQVQALHQCHNQLTSELTTNMQAASDFLNSDPAMRTLAHVEFGCDLTPAQMAALIARMCMTASGRTVRKLFKFTGLERRDVFCSGVRELAAMALTSLTNEGAWPECSVAMQMRRGKLVEADGWDKVSSPNATKKSQ